MRKIAIVSLAATAAALGLAREARAQDRSGILEPRHQKFESPQNFAFELRFSPYKPDVDSDPALGGQGPFNEAFGSSQRVLVAAEFDWQVLRIPFLGTVGPGISAGYTSMSAKAPLATPRQTANGTITTSGENTSLEIFPFYLVAVLRADVFMRDAHIPLVPYVKAGVSAALWRASNDLGTSSYNGIVGKGHTFGTMAALGLSLDLNTFDEYTARNFDNSMGVNHTYLFAEVYSLDLTGLGVQRGPLRVGATTWAAGLAFEF